MCNLILGIVFILLGIYNLRFSHHEISLNDYYLPLDALLQRNKGRTELEKDDMNTEQKKYLGKSFIVSGIIMTLVGIPFTFFFDIWLKITGEMAVLIGNAIMVLLPVVLVIITLILTEIHMRRIFDKNGDKK